MKTMFMIVIGSLLMLLSVASCGGQDEGETITRHVLLVYLGGDNNLSAETTEKLEALSRDWVPTDGRLLVYEDKQEEEGARLIELLAGGKFRLLHSYGPENSADAAVLRRVLEEVRREAPARSYGLLVFSHGTGWYPPGGFPPLTRSIVADGKQSMEITDFAAALPDGWLDYIVFEACLMGSVEVAYELRNKTNTLLFSPTEILSPGFTPVYPQIRECLFRNPPALAEAAECYYHHCNELEENERSATVSVVNTAGLEALAEAVRPVWTNHWIVLPDAIQNFDGYVIPAFFDLGDYLEKKSEGSEEYQPIREALDRVVVWKAATPAFMGYPITQYSGLSTYIERAELPVTNAAYRRTSWYLRMKGK